MKNEKDQSPKGIKRTLNLTSLTINAMALIAPELFSGQHSKSNLLK